MRVTGSLAFVAAARAAYLVTPDPNDPERRLFVCMKNNLAPRGQGLAYRFEPAIVSCPGGYVEISRVVWESQPVQMTADEAMEAGSGAQKTSALSEAVDWLREFLKDGPVPAAKVYERAEADGIARKTLQRASVDLGVLKIKPSMTEGWSWSLPTKVAKTPEGGQKNGLGTFGEDGHLRDEELVEEEI
jgi:hypothetical protein